MPRLLKRDYDTKELLEISVQLVSRAVDNNKNCYTTVERTKNGIELAFYKQITKMLELKLRERETVVQRGLF
jgi:hypothetical protein